MNELWGELPSIVDTDSGIIAVERSELTKIRPLSIDMDYIHINERFNETFDSNNVNHYMQSCDRHVSHVPIGNPFIIHSIKLLQFMSNLENKNDLPTHHSIPQLIPTNKQLLSEYSVPKINGKNINEIAVKQLLRRALVLITVFYGYENTSESILDLLVDITAEYLLRMCQTLRSTTDAIELQSSNDFVDVIDRVFHDMNVPDFESLRQFELDIRLYNQNLTKEALRKHTIKQSINSSAKSNSSEFANIANNDKSPHISVNTQSDPKEFEQTLSLKSLLNSNKSDELQENSNESILLTSPMHSFKVNTSNKSDEN